MINVVFFGTPEFAKIFLAAIHADEDIFVSAVVAQPDKPVGRKKIMTAPPTKLFAEEHGIRVFQPASLSGEDVAKHLQQFNADYFVVVAYGKIIPQTILDIPKNGAINVHPSLLPKYRGPSPIQAAIAHQDTETAVSIMLMDAKMDHGPILAQIPLPIASDDTSESLLAKTGIIGAPLLVETLKKHASGAITPQEQSHDNATFCKLLTKENGRVDWIESAEAIEAKARAYYPWPGIWTQWNGKTLKLARVTIALDATIEPGVVHIDNGRLLIGTSTNPIEVQEIQPEGKPAMTTSAFLQGNGAIAGAHLQ